jgi:DNA-binding PadR family transcriptional regulator
VEAAVLGALIESGGANFPAEIFRDLRERGVVDADFRVGQLYDTIDRLFRDFSLVERAQKEPGRNGTTRQYWRINGRGRSAYNANLAWWLSQQHAVTSESRA